MNVRNHNIMRYSKGNGSITDRVRKEKKEEKKRKKEKKKADFYYINNDRTSIQSLKLEIFPHFLLF